MAVVSVGSGASDSSETGTSRERLLGSVALNPAKPVTWHAQRVGISEAMARKILLSEGKALPSQWRAKRKKGTEVIAPSSPQVAPAPTLENPPSPDQPIASFEELPTEEVPTLTWGQLMRSHPPPLSRSPLESIRFNIHLFAGASASFRRGLDSLEGTRARVVSEWDQYVGPTSDAAPLVLTLLGKPVMSEVVLANMLLADIDKRTAGGYDHVAVPKDELELLSRLWESDEVGRKSEEVQAFERLVGGGERSPAWEREGREPEGAALVLAASVIRFWALDRCAWDMVDAAREQVSAELRHRETAFRCKSFEVEMERSAASPPADPWPAPTYEIGKGPHPHNRAERLEESLRRALVPLAKESIGYNLIRTGTCLEMAPSLAKNFLTRSQYQAYDFVSKRYLDQLESLVPSALSVGRDGRVELLRLAAVAKFLVTPPFFTDFRQNGGRSS